MNTDAQYMTLIWRSKPLGDDRRTLNSYGIHAHRKEDLHLVSRWVILLKLMQW